MHLLQLLKDKDSEHRTTEGETKENFQHYQRNKEDQRIGGHFRTHQPMQL
jgi:hypothetical protein